MSPDIDETIITEPDNAVTILKALCAEMDNRYDILASVGQRNISDYNEKVRDGKIKDTEEMIHRPMPYIVAVVDELADLMLKAGKEIETPINSACTACASGRKFTCLWLLSARRSM